MTDQIVLTWTASSLLNVASSSLNVDGKAVTTIYGPYAAGVQKWNIATVFGPLGVGVHSYTIQSTDSKGNMAKYSGTFAVVNALMVDTTASPSGQVSPLTNDQLQTMAMAAGNLWTSKLGSAFSTVFDSVTVQLADLPKGVLGEVLGTTILLDSDAAGYGWFVDSTPNDNVEFANVISANTLAAQNGTAAAARVDLLTAVMHELGDVLGKPIWFPSTT